MLLRDGDLKAATTTHSLVNDFRRQRPELSEKDLAKLPKNVIVRALGMNASLSIDRIDIETQTGDVWLICSGNLEASLSNEKLRSIVRAGRSAEEIKRNLSAALKTIETVDDCTFAVYVTP